MFSNFLKKVVFQLSNVLLISSSASDELFSVKLNNSLLTGLG